jgi:Caspase domain
MSTGISLHLGLNRVDSGHYQGWEGPLAACESDARDMERIARSQGFRTQTLLTQECTRAAVTEALDDAASVLREGDMFLWTASCHGGQLPDLDHDEPDSLDETLCLYDAEWLDDETNEKFARFAPGVRILWIVDACHSGSADRRRQLPAAVARSTYLANRPFYESLLVHKRQREAVDTSSAMTITLGACRDDQSATDGERNGRFTGALLGSWAHGTFDGDYLTFYRAIRDRMPQTQIPTFNAKGAHALQFSHQRPFTITESSIHMTNTMMTDLASTLAWGRGSSGDAKPAKAGDVVTPLTPGDYVTSRAAATTLYLFENDHLEPIQPPEAIALGLTQSDIKIVDPAVLATYPVATDRSRDQTFHWWSDLGAGHNMESWAWIEPGKVNVRTITETHTWFGGYTGGMTAVLVRADGTPLRNEIRASFGVDGTAIPGGGRRDETYTWDVADTELNQVDRIDLIHYWDARVDVVAELVKWVKTAIEIYLSLQNVEGVSVGSEAV